MFVTWELLFLFAGFVIALLTYIDIHNKKKEPPLLATVGGYFNNPHWKQPSSVLSVIIIQEICCVVNLFFAKTG